jgi:putative tricarboxylic transport membrane protein
MKRADIVTALFLAAVGAVVIFDSLRLGVGWGSDGPRSGFFPFWLAVIMIVCAAGIVGQALRRANARPFVTREQIGPVLWVLVPAAGFVALTGGLGVLTAALPFLAGVPVVGPLVDHGVGLYVSAAVYLAFYMRRIGRHGWPAVLLLAVGIPVVTFFIFEKWFLVPMPKGPLEQWLGY